MMTPGQSDAGGAPSPKAKRASPPPTLAALPGADACCAAWTAGTDPAAFEEGMRQLVAKARPVTRFGMPLPGAFALNKLRIGEVWLGVGPDTRRYTEMHGDAWRYTEMHGHGMDRLMDE